MNQTICFTALLSLPLEQQQNMVKRLQKQNANSNESTKDLTFTLTVGSNQISQKLIKSVN